jgi:heat shock protein HslJ
MKLKKYQFKKGPKKTNSDKKMTKIDKKKNVTGKKKCNRTPCKFGNSA